MIAFTRPDGSWTTLMMPLVTRTSQPGGRRSAKPTQSSTCWTRSVMRGAGPRSNGKPHSLALLLTPTNNRPRATTIA